MAQSHNIAPTLDANLNEHTSSVFLTHIQLWVGVPFTPSLGSIHLQG
jgi:hypothetical protein